MPPPTQLTTQQIGGRGRAVISGAFEVILRRPSSNIQNITADNEMQDGFHSEGEESTDEQAIDTLGHLPSECPHVTSTTLVDQDRERELELENEKVCGTTRVSDSCDSNVARRQ